VNGKTIAIDYLSADGDGERFPALAAECVRFNADTIVVSTTPAARAAKTAPLRSSEKNRDWRNWRNPPSRRVNP
jgi:hypothetical protein